MPVDTLPSSAGKPSDEIAPTAGPCSIFSMASFGGVAHQSTFRDFDRTQYLAGAPQPWLG
jgi:hypothetical protein